MKRIASYLVPALGLIGMSLHLSSCRTLSTTAGSPASGPINGMVYYLPIGKITIKGEFKDPSANRSPGGSTKSTEQGGTSSIDDSNVELAASPPVGKPSGDGDDPASPGAVAISAGDLTITLTPEVEADEAAGEYYVIPKANYVYDDETRVTVNAKQLLSTGNVTTEDKTADIVGAVTSMASQAMKGFALVPARDKKNLPPPFYFSFHPTNYNEYQRVKNRLKLRGITFRVDPAPSPNEKQLDISIDKAKQLGEKVCSSVRRLHTR